MFRGKLTCRCVARTGSSASSSGYAGDGPPPPARLAEALEVSERTVYRDVRDLLSSGVPIQGEAAYWGQSWTLTAWCEMRNGFRNFRLDRIEGLQITEERFDQVPGHTLADFLALMAAEEHAIKNVQSCAAK